MRTILTVPEMTEEMQREVALSEKKRRIYKTESEEFKRQQLATDIARAVQTISDGSRVKVDFDNPEDVRQRIIDYFSACGSSGIFPSVQGLAVHGFGISRQALNQWRNRKENTRKEAAKLIDIASDIMADILTNQSLHNNANPVQALFQLKNNHAFSDRVELQAVPVEEEYESIDEIKERWRAKLLADIPEWDDE